jgi:hypothetical protein
LFELAVGLGDDPPAAGLDVAVELFEELPHAARATAARTPIAVTGSLLVGRRRAKLAGSMSSPPCQSGMFRAKGVEPRGELDRSVRRLDEAVDGEL